MLISTQPDNFAFQPKTGNHYVIEDNPNGDIFACLPDGADRDIKTDGCVKILSVKDTSAEPTGFKFTADGQNGLPVDSAQQRRTDAEVRRLCDGRHHQDYRVQDSFSVSALGRGNPRASRLVECGVRAGMIGAHAEDRSCAAIPLIPW